MTPKTLRRRDFLRYGAIGVVAALLPASERRSRAGAEIVSCAIHPAIGIARVGNSPDQYFLGAEVPGAGAAPSGGFRDTAGRIKRQAARFRIYGLDADGNVVRELTADEAEITWTVHLANKKAAWYTFDLAFDIPEASGQSTAGGAAPVPLQSARRNTSVAGADRGRLTIDPGPRTISGPAVNSSGNDSSYAFDTGQFAGQRVPLGELRTDESGRLLVLGGFGSSAPLAPGLPAASVSNNDGWHDDTSDGPVEATVRIGDTVVQATGAWVVVAPPDFAPGIRSVVTMYDVIFEAATRLQPERAPARPSFTRQIYPLLERHVQNQWVNAGMAQLFGWGKPGDFLAPATLAQLASASDQSKAARQALFQRFRNPVFSAMEPASLPPYYGDNTNFPAQTPRQWMAVLQIQYDWLRQWANGDFDADWPAAGMIYPDSLESLPLEDQPAALDRAALDECSGGPFHPGCEITWPMRVLSIYEAPFRLRRRSGAEPDWGDQMSSAIALGANGPLSASGPGDLTRWMAVPWQTDTASCLSAYEVGDIYLPTFWPARVPNDVLTMDNYRSILDPSLSADAKQAAFAARAKWFRGLPVLSGGSDQARMSAVISQWSQLGLVTRRDGPTNDPAFPPALWVEEARLLPPFSNPSGNPAGGGGGVAAGGSSGP